MVNLEFFWSPTSVLRRRIDCWTLVVLVVHCSLVHNIGGDLLTPAPHYPPLLYSLVETLFGAEEQLHWYTSQTGKQSVSLVSGVHLLQSPRHLSA